MATKKYDIAVKVGEYTAKDGSQKGRWQNVGVMMEGDNGPFLMLAKWFNPAGVMDTRGGESILLSLFEPKQYENGDGQGKQREQAAVRSSGDVPSAAKTAAAQRAAPSCPRLGRQDRLVRP